MGKKAVIGIVITILIISALVYFFVIRKEKAENLTDAELRDILLKGNRIAGTDIEAMNRQQLIAAIKSGGYSLS